MTLKKLLLLDAVTCIAMGLFLTAGAPMLATLFGLPEQLLLGAGAVLLPLAVVILAVGVMREPTGAGAWTIIAGNIGWVVASVVLLLTLRPNGLGTSFVLAQGAVVLCLAIAEYRAVPR